MQLDTLLRAHACFSSREGTHVQQCVAAQIIKSRVRLLGSSEWLPNSCRGSAQVVENILDDDQDMEDMNLGRRAENEEKLLSVSI